MVQHGKINMILGCMFSSKTSTLISRYNRYTIGGKKCLLIKHQSDTRYDDKQIVTHDGIKVVAIVCNHLYEVDWMVKDYDVVCVDEIQFYNDANIFCDKWANQGLIVEVCGLNGTSDRKPFEMISKLVPLAADITFLTAIDRESGNDAIYSKRLSEEKGDVLIGGDDKYCAVDRCSYFKNISSQKYHKDKFVEFINVYEHSNDLIDKVAIIVDNFEKAVLSNDITIDTPVDYISIMGLNIDKNKKVE